MRDDVALPATSTTCKLVLTPLNESVKSTTRDSVVNDKVRVAVSNPLPEKDSSNWPALNPSNRYCPPESVVVFCVPPAVPQGDRNPLRHRLRILHRP